MQKYFHLSVILFFIIFSGCTDKSSPSERYVILISFDGFRYDYSDSVKTPALDKMAEEGVRASGFKPIFPSKTFPNHYSIATGLYAENHGIVANKFYDPELDQWYRLGDTASVRDGKWYGGEPIWVTAEKNNIKTASYFWVGTEAAIKGISPSYFYYYNHFTPHATIVEQAKNWLALPAEKRPHLILLYFHDTDDQGHRYGPLSPQNRMAIQSLDSVIYQLRDEISDLDMHDRVDIILVSDHGMRSISEKRVINIEKIIDAKTNKIIGYGPVMNIHVGKGNNINDVYGKLKHNESHYRVFKRGEVPEKWHYRKSPRIGDIIIVADPGWVLIKNIHLKRLPKIANGGTHGYDNDDPQMQGIFFAVGPDFKKGYKAKQLRNIDVFPLIAHILRLEKVPAVDGSLDSIRIVLN